MAGMPTMTETKPKRRWFRFSLRTFLIAITLFGAWLGWNIFEAKKGISTLTT
jgi:hypothetical protein